MKYFLLLVTLVACGDSALDKQLKANDAALKELNRINKENDEKFENLKEQLFEVQLNKCKDLYEEVRNNEEIQKQLKEQGTTFDQRVDDSCRRYIKDGEVF